MPQGLQLFELWECGFENMTITEDSPLPLISPETTLPASLLIQIA